MTEFIVEKASLTDVGQKRGHNEDFLGHFEPTDPEDLASSGRLYIVADGVGGGAAGEIASEYAVRKVLHEYYQTNEPDLGQRLQTAIQAAHSDLYHYVERNPELGRMGTTLVAAIIHGDQLIVGNVGDSRAYLVRNGEIRQITRDHSLVAKLIEEGSITAEEAETHPRRNVLLRSLGVDPTVRSDIFVGQLQLGDQIILCSDGLTRHVSDEEILNLVTRTRADRAAKQLVDLANVRGGRDNISVFLLRLTEEVDLAALAHREARRAELVAPEFDDLHDTAHRRRTLAAPPELDESEPWRPPSWMWLALGAAIALLALGCFWLVKGGLDEGLLPAGLSFGGAALLLVLALAFVLVRGPRQRRVAEPRRRSTLPWLLGGVAVAAIAILGVILVSGPVQPPTPTVTAMALTVTQMQELPPPATETSPPSTTPTPSATDTPTPTRTDTATPTPSPTATGTPTPTDTATPTSTPTPTYTDTPTPTATPTSPSLGSTWTRPADGMVMVWVLAGEFTMGSSPEEANAALVLCQQYRADCGPDWFVNEQPTRTVTLDGFWIDSTEVTNAQYQQCVEAGECEAPRQARSFTRELYYGNSEYEGYPVIYVERGQAEAYCEWAGGRLPTEVEWEYAARGPERRVFPWGNDFNGGWLNYCDANCPFGWADGAADDGYEDTAPVGNYPNGTSWVGAFDMAGNVWEWVAGNGHFARGGSWDDNPSFVRAANCWQPLSPEPPAPPAGYNLGFRCVGGSP